MLTSHDFDLHTTKLQLAEANRQRRLLPEVPGLTAAEAGGLKLLPSWFAAGLVARGLHLTKDEIKVREPGHGTPFEFAVLFGLERLCGARQWDVPDLIRLAAEDPLRLLAADRLAAAADATDDLRPVLASYLGPLLVRRLVDPAAVGAISLLAHS